MINYIKMMRLDHWIKNTFIVPGAILAVLVSDVNITSNFFFDLALAFIASSLIASANYTINEWLDREQDGMHPDKKSRPAVLGLVSKFGVTVSFALLALSGLALAAALNELVFLLCLIFLVSGLVYNVAPIRAKDKKYVDVLVESINNPIRLYIGWFAVIENSLIPLSLVLSYWFFGAFLMNSKRITDFFKFDTQEDRAAFRPSLAGYDINMLYTLGMVYSSLSTSMFLTFSVRYKNELILLLPLIVLTFAFYFKNSLGTKSFASDPERIMRKPIFGIFILISGIFLYFLLSVELETLDSILFLSNRFK
jgi:4-hydroxybenzoate polyprenyltransferase